MKHYPLKKIIFIVMMLFCFGILSYKTFFYFDKESEKKQVAQHKNTSRLTPAEMAQIQEGDFILRRGFGFFSDYISKNLNTGNIDVTHAGIIVKKNGNWLIIHSLSSDVSAIDGVQIQTLNDFLSYSAPGKIIITSVKNTTPVLQKKIALQAEEYLKKKIPFDHNGKIDDSKELFCTELIWQILEKDLHHVILPQDYKARKKLFYSMEPMYNTYYFNIKINQYATQALKH